ncbi:uncharacterized protein Triagg1_8269 [Trichoderma aggressivum f. europaeum]|uniref:Uncharacterized protein n=1 Tax=Trichoderma aggressivum f. europaeum TaxID=173218 RepID=A0AAE1IC72_9HYPO|nr:hypothetical protein Triagg1_8269 [Trichoderma aggressivum f. europaeum]
MQTLSARAEFEKPCIRVPQKAAYPESSDRGAGRGRTELVTRRSHTDPKSCSFSGDGHVRATEHGESAPTTEWALASLDKKETIDAPLGLGLGMWRRNPQTRIPSSASLPPRL